MSIRLSCVSAFAKIAAVLAVVLAMQGCASRRAAVQPIPPPHVGLAEVLDRPAERALLEGWRAYDDGQYVQAEAALTAALAGDLNGSRDRAMAYKLLAFMACASGRPTVCETMFRAAFDADATFRLVRAEQGHPLWGPVYQRVLLARKP